MTDILPHDLGGRSVPSPAVLLLSPLLMDARAWGGFAPALAEHVGVRVCVRPGHGPGQPAPPQPFDPLAVADAAVDLVEASGGSVDVVVAVGDDLTVATHLALRGRVRALVLFQPQLLAWPEDFEVEDHETRPPSDDYLDALGDAVAARDPVAFGVAQAGAVAGPLSQEDRAALGEMYADHFAVALDHVEWPDHPHPGYDDLREVTVPALVVAPGVEADRPLTTRLAATCADLLPHSQLVAVPSASDFPWLTIPDEILPLVLDFVTGLDG